MSSHLVINRGAPREARIGDADGEAIVVTRVAFR
jgi:hypothetical protein